MYGHEVRAWSVCVVFFVGSHWRGFRDWQVVYFQLSMSAPASRTVSVSSGSRFSINPLWLLHYRLRSDVLSSGTMVSALSVDMEFISRILHLSRSRIPRLPNSCTISMPYIAMLAVLGHCLKVCRTIRRVLVLLATWMSHGEYFWTFFNTTTVAIIVYISKPIWLFALSTDSDVVYRRCNMVTWILSLAHLMWCRGEVTWLLFYFRRLTLKALSGSLPILLWRGAVQLVGIMSWYWNLLPYFPVVDVGSLGSQTRAPSAWQYIAVLGHCLKVCRTIRRVLVLLARLNVIWWVYWPFRHKCFFTIVTFVSKSSYSSRIRLISDLWIGWKIDVVLFLDSCLHVQQRGVLRSLFWLLTHSFHD